MSGESWAETALVAVDIGNTRIKLGGYSAPSLATEVPSLAASFELKTSAPELARLPTDLPAGPVRWLVSSVHRGASETLAAWVARHRPGDRFERLTCERVPLGLEVDHPQRVGMDRLMVCLAADHLRDRQHPAVVVSIGSAITVNLVTARGTFAGGAILPGLFMAAEALAGKTDALPLVSRSLAGEPPVPCGRNTEAAIAAGLYWGAVGAVRELIARIGQGEVPSTNLFFSGGDGQQFAAAVDPQAVYREDLALLGVALAGRRMAGGG